MKVSSCYVSHGVSVSELIPVKDAINIGGQIISTFILRGKIRGDVLNNLDLNSRVSYGGVIKLPDPESIVEFYDAPASAKSIMIKRSWEVVDMKILVYKGPHSYGGYTLVCTTLEHDSAQEIAIVSQCNDFYENDISKLRSLLDWIIDEKK